MITKGEVFDGYVMILSAILGVRPYIAIMKKMGKMWILACCQVSRSDLCLSGEFSIDVNDHDEML